MGFMGRSGVMGTFGFVGRSGFMCRLGFIGTFGFIQQVESMGRLVSFNGLIQWEARPIAGLQAASNVLVVPEANTVFALVVKICFMGRFGFIESCCFLKNCHFMGRLVFMGRSSSMGKLSVV